MAQTVSFSGPLIVYAHSTCASAAFISALIIGLYLHYFQIVKNGVAGWPDEWWPSVSATIGDWYPERSIFQIFIALTSGPRFAMLFGWWLVSRRRAGRLANVIGVIGVIRTVSCGGWVYISSTDDHDWHDILMITYLVLTLPWMLGCIACSPPGQSVSRKQRRLVASSFFLALVPMIYFFIRHKILHIPGAYTYYSFFEWYLIFADVAFDSRNALDFSDIRVTIGIDDKTGRDMRGEKDNSDVQFRTVVMSETSVAAVIKPTEQSTAVAKSITNAPVTYIDTTFKWTTTLHLLSEIYLAYVFWSIFTSLALTLFYFSVWELAISGAEIALLSTWSPIFLITPPLKQFASSHTGRCIFLLISMSGLAAYRLEKPLHRLFAVSFANIVQTAGAAAHWSTGKRDRTKGFTLGVGILLSVVAKLANHANLPTWPIVDEKTGGCNQLGIALAILALTEVYLHKPAASEAMTQAGSVSQKPAQSTALSFLSAAGAGALLFAIHSLLSDSGTLVAWSWTGYPLQGPILQPHGILVVIAMALGLTLATMPWGAYLPHNSLWLSYGLACCYCMYTYRDWPGFFGGLGLAVFLMSLLPSFLDAAGRYSPGGTWFTVWTVNNLLDLAHVWVVAYAFVPGGVYLRERTDFVLEAMMLLIAGGMFAIYVKPLPLISRASSAVFISGRYILSILVLLSLAVMFYRMPLAPPVPHRPGERIITAGIWTVHFGIDLEGRDSQRRMRDLVQGMELDVLGLLETDLHRIVYGNRDLTQVIAEDLGYYVDLGPGPQKHTWGAALLSKFPILNSTHHLLPSPYGELAPAISATLNVYGTPVHVIVSHDGQEEDALDRQLQSQELGRIMSELYPEPTIFLGYVVTLPKADRPAPYKYLVEDGRMYDIDESDWDRWCEYVLYRGLWRVGYARVSRSTITDTELQVGKFVLPRHGTGLEDVAWDDRYVRTTADNIPEAWRFPSIYQGYGTNGHFYHVFPEGPRYFAPPPDAKL